MGILFRKWVKKHDFRKSTQPGQAQMIFDHWDQGSTTAFPESEIEASDQRYEGAKIIVANNCKQQRCAHFVAQARL